jgi:hypothetical protein
VGHGSYATSENEKKKKKTKTEAQEPITHAGTPSFNAERGKSDGDGIGNQVHHVASSLLF